MAMTTVEATRTITGGVDTHLDVHVAAALDPLGGLLGTKSFGTTPAGYKELLAWLESFGVVRKIGVEGTGSYGTGLARFLRSHASKSTGRTGPNGVDRGSPTPSMRQKPHGLRSVVERSRLPRPKTATSRRSGCSSLRSAPQDKLE
jgi:transposase